MNSVPKSLTRWNGYYIEWSFMCTSNFSLNHPKKTWEVFNYEGGNDFTWGSMICCYPELHRPSPPSPCGKWLIIIPKVNHCPQSNHCPLLKWISSCRHFQHHYSIQKYCKLSKVTYQSSKGSEEDESHIETHMSNKLFDIIWLLFDLFRVFFAQRFPSSPQVGWGWYWAFAAALAALNLILQGPFLHCDTLKLQPSSPHLKKLSISCVFKPILRNLQLKFFNKFW